MTWIDTPLVRDAQADLPAFTDMLALLPGALGKTLPVDTCVVAFVEALAHRKRRVYVPRWIAALGWIKPVLTSRLIEQLMLTRLGPLISQIDRQVAELGRSTSVRTAPFISGSSP